MPNLDLKFDFTPRKWQAKCFKIQKKHTVLAVHRRAGKTTLAIAELIIKAWETRGLYAYIAPELKQSRLIAWDELKRMTAQFLGVRVGTRKVNLVEIHETEPYVEFNNGSRIMLFGADKPDRLRGTKLAGAIIDEVAQMPRELWFEIVQPALMDSNGWALFIGTPKGVNLFSELFEKGLNPEKNPNWISAKFTCYETDALSPEIIEQYKRDTDEETFKREMLCDFSAQASNQLISAVDASDAAKRSINPLLVGRSPLVLGVDVARFGSDASVLMARKGIIAYDPIFVRNADLMTLASIVRKYVREKHPSYIFVDGTGVGGGVVDILRSYGVDVFDVNFGNKSSEPQYFNKRTEMWCKMAAWIRKGGIIPDNAQLIKELSMPTYDINDRYQKVLESKAKIRDRLGESPDAADALCLTFAEAFVDASNDMEELELDRKEQAYVTPNANPYRRFEIERGYRAWGWNIPYRRAYR